MVKRSKDKHLGITFDRETHYKLCSVSEYEGRSISAHVLYLIRKDIVAFEKEHGKIPYPPEDEE